MKDIEREIKWLKEYVEQDRAMRKNSTESDFDKFCEEHCKAIETVLKAYKEQERENQMLKNTKNNCPHLNTSGVSCNIKEHYIEKDKIREKIKEYLEFDKKYKTYTYHGRENFTMQYYYAKALKELLEEE